jgi:hypothetical protein
VRVIEQYCDHCHRGRRFEQPPCADGHGPDCAEWACVACGEALLIATDVVQVGGRRRPVTTVRRAA